MNKYIFLFFNLLGVSVSDMSAIQMWKLSVSGTFGDFQKDNFTIVALLVQLQWKWEDYSGWWMKMWDTAWIKVLSDGTVAHGDEYKATAAAAEHFNTNVVLLKGILVERINILNYKNVMNEVPGILLSAVFCQWNYVVLVLCRVVVGSFWAIFSNLKYMVCMPHVNLAFIFRESQFPPRFFLRF